jgi:tetratricopeptide (TPR) repeat protein
LTEAENGGWARELALGVRHHQAGELDRAEALYRSVLAQEPRQPDALHLLGVLAQSLGRHDLAVTLIGAAIAVAPGNPVYHHHLGLALRQLGRAEDAVASFRAALARDERSALTHTCLGNALKALGRFAEAVAAHQRAVELDPSFAQGWSNLGLTYRAQGKLDDAAATLRKALTLSPGVADLHHNLGNTYLVAGKLAQAEASLAAAIEIDRGHVRARVDLATALKEQGKLDEAIEALERLIADHPDCADAHFNLALALLMKGDTRRGWVEYEWRRQVADIPIRRVAAPLWDGSPLAGRALLVHAEQGLGDTIQFVRYGRFLRERAGPGRVLFETHPPLARLLAGTAGFDDVVPRGQALPAFDVHLPLMSAPGLLHAAPLGVPEAVPYLAAEADRIAVWRERLGAVGRCRIGLAWQGNPSYRADHRRSIPLAALRPLAALAGVRLISLQHGAGTEQLRDGSAVGFAVEDLGAELDRDGAFVDTAAVVRCLDLVVCSDSALAHLAGGLGARVWVALAAVPDWRWGLTGETMPWYPTMRLFRQRCAGDWDEVFSRMARALEDELS